MEAGQSGKIRLRYSDLLFGNGDYVVTIALHEVIDLINIERSTRFDLLDRSFQFRVYGNPPSNCAIFSHPAEWGDAEINPTKELTVGGEHLSQPQSS